MSLSDHAASIQDHRNRSPVLQVLITIFVCVYRRMDPYIRTTPNNGLENEGDSVLALLGNQNTENRS